jgi:Fur family ferric uptake transcriptional regulator
MSESKLPGNKLADHKPVGEEDQGLKKAGLKVTLPRLKILQFLETSGQHLSAEVIHQRLLGSGEDLALATVYRALAQFEVAGLVIRHHFDSEHAVFELNDGNHHDHLVCLQCGNIAEFFDSAIEALQEEIAKAHGFILNDHRLCLYGVCRNCINAHGD